MSEDRVRELHPEINWDHQQGDHLGAGQVNSYVYSAAVLAERMWRPFLRDRVLEEQRRPYFFEACEQDVPCLMPADERAGIDVGATLRTMMAIARVLEALRGTLAAQGLSLRVLVVCMDGSRWVGGTGERHIASGLWFGHSPPGQPGLITEYPPADGFRLHSRADIYEGELAAICRFFQLSRATCEALAVACQQLLDEAASPSSAAGLPSSVEGYAVDPNERRAFVGTTDCESPFLDQKRVFRSGDIRSLGGVRCLDMHETIIRERMRIHELGHATFLFLVPAHVGDGGNHNVDAVAKAALHAGYYEPPLYTPTRLVRLVAIPGERASQSHVTDEPELASVLGAGGAKASKLFRSLLLESWWGREASYKRTWLLDDRYMGSLRQWGGTLQALLRHWAGADRELAVQQGWEIDPSSPSPPSLPPSPPTASSPSPADLWRWLALVQPPLRSDGLSPSSAHDVLMTELGWRSYPLVDFSCCGNPAPCPRPDRACPPHTLSSLKPSSRALPDLWRSLIEQTSAGLGGADGGSYLLTRSGIRLVLRDQPRMLIEGASEYPCVCDVRTCRACVHMYVRVHVRTHACMYVCTEGGGWRWRLRVEGEGGVEAED